MKQVTLIQDTSKVNVLIEAIKKAGAKLEGEIHQAACSALWHAEQHGDVTIMQKLIDALPGFARRNALIAWAVEFGKFKADKEGKSVEFNKFGKTGLIERAMDKPFWEFKPEAPFQAFDMKAELAKLLKRAEKAAGDDRNSLDSDDLIALRKLSAEAKALVVKAAPEVTNDDSADDALAGVA